MSRTHPTAVAATLLALMSGGCGSSKSTGTGTAAPMTATQASVTPTSPPLTKAQLIAKADPICARLNAMRATNKIRTEQDYVRVASELSQDERQATSEMAAFTPPTPMAAAWRQMLAGYSAMAADMSQLSHDYAISDSRDAHAVLLTTTKTQNGIAAIARGVGFKDCAKAL